MITFKIFTYTLVIVMLLVIAETQRKIITHMTYIVETQRYLLVEIRGNK